MTGLDTEIALRLGAFELRAAFHVANGETVALLGPNGAGKSTLLRCLAGLHAIDEGHIASEGVLLDDPVTDVFVPAAARSVGVVFQDYLLFDNMSALDNVAFGLRTRGVARRMADATAREWLDRFELAGHAGHRPPALSGGQQQRVALARALVTEPRLLLLDEPLAALDAATRAELRRLLGTHLADFGGVCLLVTHEPLDAHALADRVMVLEGGVITQNGALADITAHPRSAYAADLAGTNLLRGTMRGSTLTLGNGTTVAAAGPAFDGPAYVVIPPRAVALYREPLHGSPRNVWALHVVDVDRAGDRVRVRLDGELPLIAEVTPAADDALRLTAGAAVWAAVKASEVRAEPA